MAYPFVRNPIRSTPVTKPVLTALALLVALGFLSGCYTQLYTRGYAERTAAYPEYSRAPRVPPGSADSAAPDTGTVGDSGIAAAREGDTLYAPPATVVVNNYYRESPYYRGYLINDWDYPSFAFGIYSTRYRDYSSPFWWNDPWYRSGGGYHTGYHGGHRGGYPPPADGGGPAGPYQSDKRIFTPEPDHPELRKGRRSREAPAADPAPKYSGESTSSSSSSSSSSSTSSSTSYSPSPSSGSSGSSSSSGSSDTNDHPALNKGRRR